MTAPIGQSPYPPQGNPAWNSPAPGFGPAPGGGKDAAPGILLTLSGLLAVVGTFIPIVSFPDSGSVSLWSDGAEHGGWANGIATTLSGLAAIVVGILVLTGQAGRKPGMRVLAGVSFGTLVALPLDLAITNVIPNVLNHTTEIIGLAVWNFAAVALLAFIGAILLMRGGSPTGNRQWSPYAAPMQAPYPFAPQPQYASQPQPQPQPYGAPQPQQPYGYGQPAQQPPIWGQQTQSAPQPPQPQPQPPQTPGHLPPVDFPRNPPQA